MNKNRRTVIDVFENQVNMHPNNIALVYNGKNMTYFELDELSDKLGNILLLEGVKIGDCVAVNLPASFELVITLLAILKIGAIYVPVDTALPYERLKYILENSVSKYICTLNEKYSDTSDRIKNIYVSLERISASKYFLETYEKSSEIAYIMYTSGTTGYPKGVIIRHSSVVNLCEWFGRKYKVCEATRTILLASISFDVSIEEMLGTILNGGVLYIPEQFLKLHKNAFRRFIEENQITMIQSVPVLLREFLCDEDKLNSLDVIICGGDKLNERIKNEILLKGYKLFNHYGPTETTVDAFVDECSLDRSVSIGYPIDNVIYKVLNEDGIEVEVGEIGELYIGGAMLAKGYIDECINGKSGFMYLNNVRFYRTGDYVCVKQDKRLEFIGRVDGQVKIRGQRIELSEIEHTLLKIPGVQDVVIDVSEIGEDKNIDAYILSSGVTRQDIISNLKTKLPIYMIPNNYFFVSKWELTRNDKIDKNKLRENSMKYEKKNTQNLFEQITNIIKSEVEEDSEFCYDKDTELEIDSLTFMKIVVALEKLYCIEFDIEDLDIEKYRTINDFVQYVYNKQAR